MLYLVQFYNGGQYDTYYENFVGMFDTLPKAKRFAVRFYDTHFGKGRSMTILEGKLGAFGKFKEILEYTEGKWSTIDD